MHFIGTGALGILLAWSLQCQAESNSTLGVKPPVVWDGQISEPNVNPSLPRLVFSRTTSNNLCIPKLAGVEAMAKFLGTNHPVSIVTHSDAWHPENAQCFLVTSARLTTPVVCGEPLNITATFWGLVRGSLNAQRLDETELVRRRTILMQIVSEEEPALVKRSHPESLSTLFECLIPSSSYGFNGNSLFLIEEQIAANPRIRERILQAIRVEKTTQ